MTLPLARRSRAVAEARPPDRWFHDIFLAASGGLVLAGAALGEQGLVAAGVAGVAYQLGRRLVNPERAYMEGFTDGLAAADTIATLDGRPAQDIRRVPPSPELPPPGAADGGTEPRQRAAPRPVEQPLDWNALAGIALGDRPARPSRGAFVDEPVRSGPRPPDFPPVVTADFLNLPAGGDGTARP